MPVQLENEFAYVFRLFGLRLFVPIFPKKNTDNRNSTVLPCKVFKVEEEESKAAKNELKRSINLNNRVK